MQDGVEGGANKNGRDAAEVEPGVAEDLIRVYLVVADIRIVDFHMYPGEPCPPNLVLSYIPAEASMQYIHQLHQSYYSTKRQIFT